MRLLLTLATIAALAAASVHAGGPVIIEDTETRAEPRERNVLPIIIIGALVVAGLLAGGGDCYQPEPEAPPSGGGC